MEGTLLRRSADCGKANPERLAGAFPRAAGGGTLLATLGELKVGRRRPNVPASPERMLRVLKPTLLP